MWRTEREIDRLGFASLSLARLDERPQRPHVHGRERQIAEERIELFQMQRVIANRDQRRHADPEVH